MKGEGERKRKGNRRRDVTGERAGDWGVTWVGPPQNRP